MLNCLQFRNFTFNGIYADNITVSEIHSIYAFGSMKYLTMNDVSLNNTILESSNTKWIGIQGVNSVISLSQF